MKVVFTSRYDSVQKRLDRLPQNTINLIFSLLKRDSLKLVNNFREGIKQNSFRLERLKDGTIQRKRRLGYERPRTPLYGKGDEKRDKSYMNLLRIRKLKNGYKVYPSIAKHYSGRINLRLLFYVHEFGTIIKRGNSMIRIPPRPALLKAYNRYLRSIKKDEKSKTVRKAINKYIRDGNEQHFVKEQEHILRGLERFGYKGLLGE